MGRMIIEAATSIDGYWTDDFWTHDRRALDRRARDGRESDNRIADVASMVPMDDARHAGMGAGMEAQLAASCGAVVMSAHAFAAVGDPDWYADNYELQVPIFVVTDRCPVPAPRESARLQFRFVPDFATAFASAQAVAGDRAVLVVGGARTVSAALNTGQADEIWLRVVSHAMRKGAPLFDADMPFADYFVSEMDNTPGAVHMRLERRQPA